MLNEKDLSRLTRADQLQAAIAILKKEIQEILSDGTVAPPGCRVMRYRVRRQKACYWYYKLQATEPIFAPPKGQGELSKYKHLGKAGSEAHIEAVLQVARRTQIDGLQRAIDGLSESWLQVCLEEEKDQKDSSEKSSD